jgi:signal peptidase I
VNICKILNTDIENILRSSNEKFEIKTSGNSMLPLFENDSTITVLFTKPQNIKIGDIIIFKAKDFLVTHRVIKKITSGGKNYFIEKGDNTKSTNRIDYEDVLGKVIYAWKNNPITNNLSSSNESKHRTQGKAIKVDNFIVRFIGLLFSFNDFIVKNFDSLIIHFKDNYFSKIPSINISLGVIIFLLKFYKLLIQKIGKICYQLLAVEIKD